jgi:DtxR family Mn-dependent transcriptional regulator
MEPADYNSKKGQDILDFLYFWARPIRAGDLAKELKIKHSTLNSVLLRLQEDNLIKWEKYGIIELTAKGNEFAVHLTNHHLIVERFLREVLEMPEKKAHEEAMNLSGVISCDMIGAICKKLGISHDKISPQYCDSRNYLSNESHSSK